ncbi:hypothetical protein ACHWQZ_G014281 [Mnemiopsis leidyi]
MDSTTTPTTTLLLEREELSAESSTDVDIPRTDSTGRTPTSDESTTCKARMIFTALFLHSYPSQEATTAVLEPGEPPVAPAAVIPSPPPPTVLVPSDSDNSTSPDSTAPPRPDPTDDSGAGPPPTNPTPF